MTLPAGLHRQITEAIGRARAQIRWKAGKDQAHLHKRVERGHLSPGAALDEYEAIIRAVLDDPSALLYMYRFRASVYPTVVAPHKGRTWLVMISLEGILETAFPPDDPEAYFGQEPRYQRLGSLKEIIL